MGGLALLARTLGHQVTGSDDHIYPSMSTLLAKEDINIMKGYDASHIMPIPDLVIIGNVITRGNPCVETILEQNVPYISGPQWLYNQVLRYRWVIAVAGTHGKTTVASMIAWILEDYGYEPGFLIGGIPGNFNISARMGNNELFIIEADEYDCAFFDKRSKFMHYAPRLLVLNNIEFDHADIFKDIKDIQKQFHYLVRLVPKKGHIIFPANDKNIQQVIAMGCWSEQEEIEGNTGVWKARKLNIDASHFEVLLYGRVVGQVSWNLIGEHNMYNALMAIAAARHIGILPNDSCHSLIKFINARHRLELCGEAFGVKVYDDFAHHPTAIRATLTALRHKIGIAARILVVLELRSNTMKMGIHKHTLAPALSYADAIFLFQPNDISLLVIEVAKKCIQPTYYSEDINLLVNIIVKQAQPGDYILVMSNGRFEGIHHKLLKALIHKKEL
ncbi:UDP-N-acetylmuramate--L-alanyl-gamma-D-glutamyl-meso-2,6-diaminoheptandioate ligase [Candidatus Profftia lariciata]|nr:UDP-N-acetylmuramate--L-alanyl-gamma-D-glutamyl-meso-2,6-diaminoheptandioate ligase [Candidatus Profftia lariciata]